MYELYIILSIFTFLHTLFIYICISSRMFENIPQNGPEYSHREPGDNQVSDHCGEKKHRGFAFLVGHIINLSPCANSPWVGKGPPCQSLAGGVGCCKSVVLSVSLALAESVYWSCLP